MTEAEIPQTENYTVEAILGKGGMGVVYLAYDKRLNRKVAIKCIRHNRANENWVAAVTEEARLLAQINHRNIVHIYDLIDWQGSPALVMEYLQGRTLLDIFRSDDLMTGELSLSTRLHWLRQIAEGLACAHAKGIIHRDLKAENIMITDEGTVKIMDFGIARHQAQPLHANIHDSQILPGEFIGSPAALSPEQAMGDRLTTASDMFSFGILAYCLLCGHHPFGDPKNADLVLQGIIYRPPMPVQFLECLGITDEDAQALGAEIIACLNKAPGMRPAAAALALKQTIQRKAEQAVTPAPPQNSQGLAFTISTILVTATAGLIWLAGQQPEPRRNIYVAQPSFSGTDMAEFVTEATPEFLRNGIIDALLKDDRHAITQYHNTSNLKEPALLGRASGANEILTLAFECKKYWCDGRIELFSAPEWNLTKSQHYSIDLRQFADSFATTQWQLKNLGLTKSDINEPDNKLVLESYHSLLNEFSRTGELTDTSIDTLSALIETSPDFTPNYRLLVNAANRNFQLQNDSSTLSQALVLLEKNANEIPITTYLELSGRSNILLRDNEKARIAAHSLKKYGELISATKIEIDLSLNEGNYQNASTLYEAIIDISPSEDNYYGLAYSQYLDGKISDAEQSLYQALRYNPESTPSLNFLAGINMSTGNIDKAIEHYKKLVSKSPNSASFNNLAIAHMLNRNIAEAKLNIDTAIQDAPNSPSYLYNAGEIALLQGRNETAVYYLTESIKNTRSARTESDISRVIKASSFLNNFKQAADLIKENSDKFKDSSEFLFSQAVYYSLTKQTDNADKTIKKLLSIGYAQEWFNFPWFEAGCVLSTGASYTLDSTCLSPFTEGGGE